MKINDYIRRQKMKFSLAFICLMFIGQYGYAQFNQDDIRYIGESSLPVGVGFTSYSLGYKPDTDTFLTVGDNSYPQLGFNLYEIKMVEIGQPMKLIKNWGPINPQPEDRLHTKISDTTYNSLMRFGSILWDSELNGFWGSWSSSYTNPEKTPHFFAFFRLKGDIVELVGGPWKCEDKIMLQVRYGVQFSTPKLKEATGYDFVATSLQSSSNGKSWGPGLVGFNKPELTLAPDSVIPMESIIFYPMKTNPDGSPGKWFYYSDCPREPEDIAKYITGNSNCNPPATVSYEVNKFYDIVKFGQSDVIESMFPIRNQVLYIKSNTIGYSWYGNPKSHSDSSDSGLQFNNNLESLINLGQPIKSTSNSRGYHQEGFVRRLCGLSTESISSITAKPAQIPFEWSIKLGLDKNFEQMVLTDDNTLHVLHAGPNPSILTFSLPPEKTCEDKLNELRNDINELNSIMQEKDSIIIELQESLNKAEEALLLMTSERDLLKLKHDKLNMDIDKAQKDNE